MTQYFGSTLLPVTGLRERKRLTMMRRVQAEALSLYDANGYGNVTVEQIADRAEVSPSSVHRHFGTKEGILLWNPDNEGAVERFAAPTPGEGLLDELHRLARTLLTTEEPDAQAVRGRRLGYLLNEPALVASLGTQLDQGTDLVARVLVERTGRPISDPELQATAGALIGALFGALRAWRADHETNSLETVLDASFDAIRSGLPLITEDATG